MSEVYELKGDTKDLTFKDPNFEYRKVFIARPFKYCTACHGVCRRGFPFIEMLDACWYCGHKEYNHFRGEGEAP